RRSAGIAPGMASAGTEPFSCAEYAGVRPAGQGAAQRVTRDQELSASYCDSGILAFGGGLKTLILRSAQRVSKDEGHRRASWFEMARSLSSGRALRGPVGASSP